MKRVCIDIGSCEVIEIQSGGDDDGDLLNTRLETLRQNAINAGYEPENIVVRLVSDEEYEAMLVTPAKARESLIKQVDMLRDIKISSGVPYDFPDGKSGKIQTRDLRDFRNINGLSVAALLMAGQDTLTKFRDEGDVDHDLAPEQIISLGLAVAQYVAGIYQVAWNHKDNIAKLTSIQDLNAYDISAGW